MNKWIIFSVYLIASIVLGAFTFLGMMWIVWGRPINPLELIAFFGAIALFVGALQIIRMPERGRAIGAVALLAMGCMYIPMSIAFVPSYQTITTLTPAWFILLYFFALGIALLPRPRWRWSPAVFVTCVVASLSIASATYFFRLSDGEYARPSCAAFRWFDEGDSLVVERDHEQWIDDSLRTKLLEAGVNGRLSNGLYLDSKDNPNRIFIICKSMPPEAHKLYYPRAGTIIYVFDGSSWFTLPPNPRTYDSYAIFQTDTIPPDNYIHSSYCVDIGSGTQMYGAITWKPVAYPE